MEKNNFYLDTENDSFLFSNFSEVVKSLEKIFSQNGPVYFSVYDNDFNIIADFQPENDKCIQCRENADYFKPEFFDIENLNEYIRPE